MWTIITRAPISIVRMFEQMSKSAKIASYFSYISVLCSESSARSMQSNLGP